MATVLVFAQHQPFLSKAESSGVVLVLSVLVGASSSDLQSRLQIDLVRLEWLLSHA
jgi:hypothetical protein